MSLPRLGAETSSGHTRDKLELTRALDVLPASLCAFLHLLSTLHLLYRKEGFLPTPPPRPALGSPLPLPSLTLKFPLREAYSQPHRVPSRRADLALSHGQEVPTGHRETPAARLSQMSSRQGGQWGGGLTASSTTKERKPRMRTKMMETVTKKRMKLTRPLAKKWTLALKLFQSDDDRGEMKESLQLSKGSTHSLL